MAGKNEDYIYTQKCVICREEFDSSLTPQLLCLQCRLQEPEEDLEEENQQNLLLDPQIKAIYGDFIRHNPV